MNGDLKVNPEGVWAAIFLILATFAILATNIQLVAELLCAGLQAGRTKKRNSDAPTA